VSKETNAAAMLGASTVTVEVQGVAVEFRAPKLRDLVDLEKKLGQPILQGIEKLEVQVHLVARLGKIGGVPVQPDAILETWDLGDVARCVAALLPLFQRSTLGASSSSPAGSSAEASAPTS
jgi:hypothetical protein